MPGQVDGGDGDAAAQVPSRTVGIRLGVGPGVVVKLRLDHRAQALAGVARVAVVAGQPRPAAGGLDIGLVHPDRCARQPVQAGHVVLVHMAQDDNIDAVQCRADAVGHQRRVERGAQPPDRLTRT